MSRGEGSRADGQARSLQPAAVVCPRPADAMEFGVASHSGPESSSQRIIALEGGEESAATNGG